jgi:hypothetical protein
MQEAIIVVKARFLSTLFFIFLILGCASPVDEIVIKDFRLYFSEEAGMDVYPVILSIAVGEGDSSNVYKHVTFDVVAAKDVVIKNRAFNGISLLKGERLCGGELVMLYQYGEGKWVLSAHEWKKTPKRCL